MVLAMAKPSTIWQSTFWPWSLWSGLWCWAPTYPSLSNPNVKCFWTLPPLKPLLRERQRSHWLNFKMSCVLHKPTSKRPKRVWLKLSEGFKARQLSSLPLFALPAQKVRHWQRPQNRHAGKRPYWHRPCRRQGQYAQATSPWHRDSHSKCKVRVLAHECGGAGENQSAGSAFRAM